MLKKASAGILMVLAISYVAIAQDDKAGNGIFALIQTSKGSITIEVEYNRVPKTAANFIGLAEKGFYDGLIFHRLVPNGIIQGGDPEGTGYGHPGYSFKDEFHKDLVHGGPGVVSMANSGKHTNGSQFFITLRAIPSLDRKHSIFGKVIKGMEVVSSLEEGDVIQKTTITKVGDEAMEFNPSIVFTEKDRKKR